MKRLLAVLTVFTAIACVGEAQSSKRLAHLLQELDSRTAQLTFIWEAEVEYTRVTSEKEKQEMERITRSMGAQLGNTCDGTVQLTGRRIIIQRNGSDCAILADAFIMCGSRVTDSPIKIYHIDKSVVFSAFSTAPSNSPSVMTYIWNGESPLYNLLPNMYLNSASFPDAWLLYGLLCGSNPLQIKGLDVLDAQPIGDEMRFRGALKRVVDESFYEVSSISGRLIRRSGIWLLKQFELEQNARPVRLYQNYTVEEFTEFEGMPLPSRIRYEMKYDFDGNILHTKARLRLVKVEKSQRIIPDIPLNTQTNDLRLTEADWYQSFRWGQGNASESVVYMWDGHLPSLEELKQIAYQQGNLLPPDSPRRRYSLVMFAPAVILLLIAGYLFWKSRKK